MFKLFKDVFKKQTINQFDVHGKLLNIIIAITSGIILLFIALKFLNLLQLDDDYIIFDFPIRITGLIIAFIFNYKRKTVIAKYIFIIVNVVLSIRLLLINSSISIVPMILTFFILFPMYINFFINPKAGLLSGFSFVLLILCYYIYILVYKSYLFEEKYVLSFATIFLSPLLSILLISIIIYYFSVKNGEYIKSMEESTVHTISILNAVTDILIVLNTNGQIQTINKEGLKILEYSKEEIIGKPPHFLFLKKDDGDNLLAKICSNINFKNFKSVLKTKSNKEIIAGLNCSAINSEEKNKLTEIIITARDLTKLFKYTKKLKRMNRKALSYQSAMMNMLEDLNEKNRILSETELQVKESSSLLKKNIEEAKEHQTKLISMKKTFLHNVRFSYEYIPCENVGGDIINIIVLNDIIFFYIADVVGHGVAAAILSSFIKASLDNWINEDQTISPSKLLKKMNDVLVDQEIFKEKFFTIFIGKLFLQSSELQYISAGHLSPILVDLDNNEISEINIKGRPVISMFELKNNKHYSITLPKKSRLLVYSDGLIEWEVDNGDFFGKKNLVTYFQKEKLSKKNLDLILQRIGNKQLDDISFILIDINDTYESTLNCGVEEVDGFVVEFEDEIKGRYPDHLVPDISCCVKELITYFVIHGNVNVADNKININFLFKKEHIVLSVKGVGGGFNWQARDYLQNGLPEDDEFRRSAYLSDFSDSLKFNEKGNEVECTITINL